MSALYGEFRGARRRVGKDLQAYVVSARLDRVLSR